MRKGSHDTVLLTAEGKFVSVCLGWDHVSEHERGIKGLQRSFGISGMPKRGGGKNGVDLVGADTRTVTRVPNGLKFFWFEDASYLFFTPSYMLTEDRNQLDARLCAGGLISEPVSAAWSECDFGLRVANQKTLNARDVLGQLVDAFEKNDAMIFLSGSNNPFSNRGLHLTIRSRLPQKALDMMYDADVDHLNLTEAAAKTGIVERLKAAGKSYHALSPRWANDEEKKTTEHPVVFWLNPYEQKTNSFGWFRVEDLDAWTRGTGPIPKQPGG
jgi:hypothetical protein